jgi:hypothetical protein
MDDRQINLIRDGASVDQVAAIMRRGASGLVGPVCVARYMADTVDDDNMNRRRNWLDRVIDPLRRDCD